MKIVLSISLFFLLLPKHYALAQQKEISSLRAYQISEKIILDGELDEPAWQQAPFASDFIQRELNNGQPATEETRVVFLYDASTLYIGVWAYDSQPDEIIAKESKRDFRWGSDDNFEIILSTFNDNRNGYLFVVNPNGAIADVLITDEGAGFNKDWNAVWDAGVEVTDKGWFVEIAIPFSNLKFPEDDEQIWALNMERNIRRKNEQVLWQGWSRDYELEKISQAGKLVGLKGIHNRKFWELKPFVSTGVEQLRGRRIHSKYKIGGDVNYLLSPKMKLNFTVNTDFSQVESDREQINLSRFSLFFPEKRDFFLEGKNLFRFNLGRSAQTFYSRQIGLADRKEVPVLGGLRLTGKKGRTNLGLMTIQTGKKRGEPSTNFSVVRVKQDVLENSNVGFIVTSRKDKGHYNFLYGVDANYSTSKMFGNKNLDVGIAFSQSITQDSSNSNALGYRAYLSSINDLVEYDLSVSRITKDFNPEMGYLRRKNYKRIATELQFNPRPDFLPFARNLELKPIDMSYYLNDETNEMESFFYEWRPLGIEFKTGDFIEFNVQRFYDKLDEPFELIEQNFIPVGTYWYSRYEVQGSTYRGRPVFFRQSLSWGDFYTGQREEVAAQIGWNLGKFNMSADWQRNILKLGQAKLTTHEVGTRLEFAFNTHLYTTLFGQWNNEDDIARLDLRVNWIPKTGSYFYFVVNQEYSTVGTLSVLNTTVLSKLTWFFSV